MIKRMNFVWHIIKNTIRKDIYDIFSYYTIRFESLIVNFSNWSDVFSFKKSHWKQLFLEFQLFLNEQQCHDSLKPLL